MKVVVCVSNSFVDLCFWKIPNFIFLPQLQGRITKIFITHLHGDHFFGLPGLLCTISLQSGSTVTKQPIEIYGPAGLRDFIWRTMELSHTELVFPYVVHELVPTADQCPAEELKDLGPTDGADSSPKEGRGRTILLDSEENSYLLVDDEQFVVKAFRLFHRVPSFGFSVVEKKRPGKLNAQKLKDLGKCCFLFSPIKPLLTEALISVIVTFLPCLPGLKLTFSPLTSFVQSLLIQGSSWDWKMLFKQNPHVCLKPPLGSVPDAQTWSVLSSAPTLLLDRAVVVVSGLGFYFFMSSSWNMFSVTSLAWEFLLYLNLATATNYFQGFPSLP